MDVSIYSRIKFNQLADIYIGLATAILYTVNAFKVILHRL
jgi:hypothetical protein